MTCDKETDRVVDTMRFNSLRNVDVPKPVSLWDASEEDINSMVDAIKKANDASNDLVNHPSHYTHGGIECIEAIRASMTKTDFCGYCKGNMMKYIWRYEHKNGVEDLRKAQWYLNKLIETLEN